MYNLYTEIIEFRIYLDFVATPKDELIGRVTQEDFQPCGKLNSDETKPLYHYCDPELSI